MSSSQKRRGFTHVQVCCRFPVTWLIRVCNFKVILRFRVHSVLVLLELKSVHEVDVLLDKVFCLASVDVLLGFLFLRN